MFYFLLSLLLIVIENNAESAPRTRIKQGEIIGTEYNTYSGRKIFGFYGLPFAKPPIEDLRFEPPQPPESWDKPKLATNKSDFCVQPELFLPVLNIGNEDCLYLDVYTAEVPKDGKCKKLVDVVVYLHPSVYIITSGTVQEPYYIMDKHDLVYIPINYRLGFFGYFSTQDEVVPGNNGFKDQVMAMKWAKENARSFCGDPDRITIMGSSVGGVSVGFHLLSPLSKGLFHRAIGISGNPYFNVGLTPLTFKASRVIADQMNCPTNDSRAMVKCLREKNVALFWTIELQFHTVLTFPLPVFSTVIEHCHEGAFLTKTPQRIIAEDELNDVPLMEVENEFEGLAVAYLITVPGFLEFLDITYRNSLIYILDFYHIIPQEQQEYAVERVKQEYVGNELFSTNEYRFKRLLTDTAFRNNLYHFSLDIARRFKSPVYNLLSTYRAQFSTTTFLSIIQSNKNFGAGHFDVDMLVNFNAAFEKKVRRNKNDTEMIELMVEIVYSFIRDGKPSISDKYGWLPQDRENKTYQYLEVDNAHKIRFREDDNYGNVKFWDSLPINKSRGFIEEDCPIQRRG